MALANLQVAMPLPTDVSRGTAVVDGLRGLAVTLWSGLIAGLPVHGLGGRLLMQIMAATSSPET